MHCFQLLKDSLLVYQNYLILILTPLVLLPMILLIDSYESRCAYVIIVMAVYWVSNATHFAAVSLIPIFAFPLMGILDSNSVSKMYMNDANAVFLASLIAGVALEQSGIHKRIALLILLKIGTSPRLLLLGVMLATMCLSTWIMDTTACALMLPIVTAIVRHLNAVDDSTPEASISNADVSISVHSFDSEIIEPSFEKLKHVDKYDVNSLADDNWVNKLEKCLILSVAYASAIGGIGTLTGSTTNLVFKEIFTELYGEVPEVSYAFWMSLGIPTMVLSALGLCGLLQLLTLGCRVKRQSAKRKANVKALLMKNYSELGSLSYHEGSVLCCLFLLTILWFFRQPGFMSGWRKFIPTSNVISDSTPAYAIIVLMCILPSKWPPSKKNGFSLVDWPVVEKKIAWDILLLQGAGLAIAEAADLTNWLGIQLSVLSPLPAPLICFIISLITSIISELLSNSSVAAVLLPVVGDLATDLHIHPLYFMIPVTIAASLSFTLPVASGPNSMAYRTGKLKMTTMLKTGLLANVLTVTIMFMMINTLGVVVFHVNIYPSWASNLTVIH